MATASADPTQALEPAIAAHYQDLYRLTLDDLEAAVHCPMCGLVESFADPETIPAETMTVAAAGEEWMSLVAAIAGVGVPVQVYSVSYHQLAEPTMIHQDQKNQVARSNYWKKMTEGKPGLLANLIRVKLEGPTPTHSAANWKMGICPRLQAHSDQSCLPH